MRKVISKKVISFGKVAYYSSRKVNEVTVEIELYENEKQQVCLSICGNIWNSKKTDCVSCGQNLDELVKLIPSEKMKEIHKIWKKYHLNDMHAECEHQRENWKLYKKVEVMNKYSKQLEMKSINWLTSKEHPEGILGKECEICGYKYGHGWNHLEIPSDVIETIKNLNV